MNWRPSKRPSWRPRTRSCRNFRSLKSAFGEISPTPVKGTLSPPGDKSISHRAIMLSSLAEGESRIENFLRAEDCLSTVEAFRTLGVSIEVPPEGAVIVKGQGMAGLKAPGKEVYVGNSGTTMRLLLGILAGQPFIATLSGDASLTRRPMKRVTDPLRAMGAKIQGPQDANFPPLTVKGGELRGIEFDNELSSAQVKSALLLAGLFAEGETRVKEKIPSRDHTERMLTLFGADFERQGPVSIVRKTRSLKPQAMAVPADISSAAFFIVAALITPGSDVLIKNVILNPTRTGILKVLEKMGAQISLENVRENWEPVGDLRVRSSVLKGVRITKKSIPSLIDELPVLMVACALAEGPSEIRGAAELRVKETDRIKAMCDNLGRLGVEVKEFADGCRIQGTGTFRAAETDSFDDHRIAMSMAVGGLRSSGEVAIRGKECVAISYPRFFEDLGRLCH
ncbi:MAG: 3-phosphoshikimate 1-carboxyvinyltransferase [Candidatus Omnitrophica bacterium]|nr:3-phosphoshikimate 1-carboxyvinyltransferase [Candidatus Omnitrophota bacterium]